MTTITNQRDRPSVLYRGRRYTTRSGGWYTWFEPCPIIAHKPSYIEVYSENYPDTPLYPGGKFRINRAKLLKDCIAYHSRHGEYFYLEKPALGHLFPSKYVVESLSALETEAKSLWGTSDIQNLDEHRKNLWICAHIHKCNIQDVINHPELQSPVI